MYVLNYKRKVNGRWQKVEENVYASSDASAIPTAQRRLAILVHPSPHNEVFPIKNMRLRSVRNLTL